MALAARFEINRRELTSFEEFMTNSLQKETDLAYAKTLLRICRGCVRDMKRKLEKSQDQDDKGLLYAGIIYVPLKLKRILKLNPIRAYVGAGSVRKRKPVKSTLVGRPFMVRLKNESGKNSVGVIAQRNAETVHIGKDEATSPKRIKTITASGRVSWSRKTYQSHQSFNGYRNTALPITIISHIHLNDRQKTKFRYMVEEYVAENHDKIFEQEFKKAVEKAAKKKR